MSILTFGLGSLPAGSGTVTLVEPAPGSPPVYPYATDEDIALRVGPDFAILCPADQSLAEGSDAVFSPASPWELTSASAGGRFGSAGILPGMIAILLARSGGVEGGGQQFAVRGVSAGVLTLRGKGLAAGQGWPPTYSGPVRYQVRSLRPQIVAAAADIGRRYGIGRVGDPPFSGDARVLADLVVLSVLYRAYLLFARQADGDDFSRKAKSIKADLDATIGLLPPGAPGNSGVPARRPWGRASR